MQTDKNASVDMPTTGGARPGPIAMLEATAAPRARSARTGSRPVVLRIPAVHARAVSGLGRRASRPWPAT